MENNLQKMLNTIEMARKLKETKKKISKEMIKKAEDYQKPLGYKTNPDSRHAIWNSEADAFKHAFMSAILSKRYSIPIGKKIGDAHEEWNLKNGAPLNESNMDWWNNRVGRQTWKEVQNELKPYKNSFNDKYIEDYTAGKVMQKLKEGKLITSPDDPRKFDHNPHLNKLKNDLKGVFTGGAAPINDGRTFFATEDMRILSDVAA